MKDYNQKDGMVMIMRAAIMTVMTLVVCWIGYKTCSPKPQKTEIYIDENGCWYDETCLEQKAFARLMAKKMQEKK